MAGVSTAFVAIKEDFQKSENVAVVPKATKTKAAHPPTAEMVITAIGMMSERGGSSLSAIKKYLATNYAVDVDRLAPYIKKFLKSAVLSGIVIQTKGKGATGSFKLSKISEKPKPKPKPKPKNIDAKKKPTATKKVTKKVEGEEQADDFKAPEPASNSKAPKSKSDSTKKPKLVSDSKKPPPASPKKVEKKKVAAKVVKKSPVATKTSTKKAAKSVKATLNSSKVAKSKPKAAATKNNYVAKKAGK